MVHTVHPDFHQANVLLCNKSKITLAMCLVHRKHCYEEQKLSTNYCRANQACA